MGMFDYVKFSTECPECGDQISDFQSKDGPCELKKIRAHKLAYFYSECSDCGVRVSFHKLWGKKYWRREVSMLGERIPHHSKKFSKRKIKEMTP